MTRDRLLTSSVTEEASCVGCQDGFPLSIFKLIVILMSEITEIPGTLPKHFVKSQQNVSFWARNQKEEKRLCIIESLCHALKLGMSTVNRKLIYLSLKLSPCNLYILLLKMCANFKGSQEKRTTSVSSLSCVFSMVPSMLLYKLLFSQPGSLTCYLMPTRTEQLHFCVCNT